MKNEVWLPVKGHEGYYDVSNFGRVRSNGFRNNACEWKDRKQILSAVNNGNGYMYVVLHVDGKRKNAYIHRLVAEAFLQKRPGENYVNHKDFDKSNNEASNLEWCTQKYNCIYSNVNRKPRKAVVGESGYQYIRKRPFGYELCLNNKYYGCFKTLEEAIEHRQKELEKMNISFVEGMTIKWANCTAS